jgi:hypothetical protein
MRLTLDQLVLVRIQVRQLEKPPANKQKMKILGIISELHFIIEYTNAQGGHRSILLMNSCSSIPVLSTLHIASYVRKSFVTGTPTTA